MDLLQQIQEQQRQLDETPVEVDRQFIFARKPKKPPFPVRLSKGSTEHYRLQWELFWDKFCPHKTFRYSATKTTGEFRRCTHAKCCERRAILSEQIGWDALNMSPLGGDQGGNKELRLPKLTE